MSELQNEVDDLWRKVALDESGLPIDEVAIAEDVLGANEDETQG